MIHGLALHRAPIFLSKSATWFAFLSIQDTAQGDLYVKASAVLMKQHLKILWFKFWAAVGDRLCPHFIVHSYLSLSQIEIEKELLTGFHTLFTPFGDKGIQRRYKCIWHGRDNEGRWKRHKFYLYPGISQTQWHIYYSVN